MTDPSELSQSWISMPSDQVLPVTAAQFIPPSIVIRGESGPLVTIHPDGRLEYGPGYEQGEAARLFWEAMRQWAPAPMEREFGRPLAQTINADLARGQKAERQVEQAKALVGKWREAAAQRDDAVILVGVAADVLLATLNGINDLRGES